MAGQRRTSTEFQKDMEVLGRSFGREMDKILIRSLIGSSLMYNVLLDPEIQHEPKVLPKMKGFDPVRKSAVFVLGTMEYEAVRKGDPLTSSTMQILEHASEEANLDVDIVYVSLDPKDAGKGKSKLGMKRIREERERVLQEIGQAQADVVVCFGPVASACVFGKGNLAEGELLRQKHEIAGMPPVYVTFGIEGMRWKAGIARWLEMDILVASRGQVETQWGEYTILEHGKQGWAHHPKELRDLKVVGFDLETFPGLDPYAPGARIRMAILSDRVGRAWVVMTDPQGRLPDWVQRLAADPKVVKCGSNPKFDYRWMRRFGYTIENMEDTSTREHILCGDNPKKDLKSLTFKYVPKLGDYSKGHRDLVRERGGWEFVEDHEMLQYAGGDGEASIGAWRGQEAGLANHQGWKLFRSLYQVLGEVEHNGMKIDMRELERLDVLYKAKLSDLRQDIVTQLGPCNLNSPTQLAKALKILVPDIKLTLREWTRAVGTEEDDDSVTKREVLEREAHKHPVIPLVLEFRKYRTRHSTFIESVRDKYATKHEGRGWFIHPRYRTDVVETYRLSSQAPNGQNIPRKDNDDPELSIKRMFRTRWFPLVDGNGSIMEADQSQVEIRVAAWLSQDKKMLEAIASGEDIHTSMASIMLKKPIGDVTDNERTLCKARTFLILYGGGAAKLARDLKITRRAAQRLIDDYFDTFTGLRDYIEMVKARVKVDLKVVTPFGFERKFIRPERWESKDGFRIERQAFNTLVQSTAACITYIAMLGVAEDLHAGGFKSVMMGQVHDSILIDVYPGEEERVARILRRRMERAGASAAQYGVDNFDVPLKCDVDYGETWAEARAYFNQ